LTASIVGAALNAEEIQVWKDVDGMLTWDPRVKSGGYRVKSLSYQEAHELANAGATILHPETMAPAQRLRIPLIIRNTFRPESEGTTIGLPKTACSNAVKSIACQKNLTVLELRSPTAEKPLTEYSALIERVCKAQKTATLLATSDDVIYLALEPNGRDPGLNFDLDQCVEVHVRTDQAIVTLVGQTLKRCNVVARLSSLLKQQSILILPQSAGSCSVRIIAAQEDLAACTEILQRAFFADVDPAFFGAPELAPDKQRIERSVRTFLSREHQVFSAQPNRFALPTIRQ